MHGRRGLNRARIGITGVFMHIDYTHAYRHVIYIIRILKKKSIYRYIVRAEAPPTLRFFKRVPFIQTTVYTDLFQRKRNGRFSSRRLKGEREGKIVIVAAMLYILSPTKEECPVCVHFFGCSSETVRENSLGKRFIRTTL